MSTWFQEWRQPAALRQTNDDREEVEVEVEVEAVVMVVVQEKSQSKPSKLGNVGCR